MEQSTALMGGRYSEHGLGFQSATTDGRKGFASVLSWAAHGLIFALAISGIIPSAPVIEPPPDMVVQMIVEPPPPPPPPQEVARPQPSPPPVPEPVVKPMARKAPPAPRPPKPVLPSPQAPLATTPSPAPEAPVLPPVAAPAPPVAATPQTANPASDGLGTKRYLAGIQSLAERHLVYPPLSLRRGEQGEIHVHVKVTRSGDILDMDAGDEGTGRLRAAALAALRESAPFPPLPPSIEGDPVDIVVPVQFTIN